MPSTVPEVFDTGPEIKGKMLGLIEGAKDFILIDSFLLMADQTTMDLMEALKKKHLSGVKIYVLADSSSRFKPDQAGFNFMQEAGIPCAEYNPIRLYKLVVAPVMLRRDHRKFWIIDGRKLFLGGANILATSLDSPEDGGNRDLMAVVESPQAIGRLTESFVAAWNRSSNQKLRAEDFPVAPAQSPETDLWLFDQNDLGEPRSKILEMIDSLFATAKKEVWLIQPYTFVTSGLLERIRSLTGRGVEVNLMLSGNSRSPRFRVAAYFGIKDVLEAGGKVWVHEDGKGALHTKAIVVDGTCFSMGSANLNHRSYHLSKEVNVVFDDPKSAETIAPILEDLKRRCRPVGIAEAKRYRSLRYLATWLWMRWAG